MCERAVVRTPVSYKCGWGADKTNPHPNLPQLGKECARGAQLTYSPRPIGERVEFVSEPRELRNSGEGLKNYYLKQHPPTPFGYCLGFAPRSQNLTFGAELLSVRFARYPDYLTNVRVVRPRGGRRGDAQLA